MSILKYNSIFIGESAEALPTPLTNARDIHEQIERLEVHHLSGAGGDLTFALLADGLDAAREVMGTDTVA